MTNAIAGYAITSDDGIDTMTLKEGDKILDFRKEVHIFKSVTRLPEPGRSGKVLTDRGEFYDKVFPGLIIEEVN